ncbi:unnamed protein product [Closterium sp. NIES-65]|nr:unnamed protein product [Closterium sp. NIES-65]
MTVHSLCSHVERSHIVPHLSASRPRLFELINPDFLSPLSFELTKYHLLVFARWINSSPDGLTLPQDPPSVEANRSLVHQPTTTTLVEPNGTAEVHNVTGLVRLQSHEGTKPSVQPARFQALPLYLLHTLLYVLYTALCPLIVLLWWMNVTQGQVREWLLLQGLAARAKLTMLKRAAASFMELDNYPLLRKAIEIGSFGKTVMNETLVVVLRQRAGTESLEVAMLRAEERISSLERHLEDSRKELEEREGAEAGVRREVHETKDELQALKRELEHEREERGERSERAQAELNELRTQVQETKDEEQALTRELEQREKLQRTEAELSELRRQVQEIKSEEQALTRELEQEREERRRGVGELTDALAQGNAAMERLQREAGERDRAVHALMLSVDRVVQMAPCKLELVVVKSALAALKERVHGYKTAADREMREVREQAGRELMEVKGELAAVKREVCENKAASQRKLNELRNIIGAVEQRNGCTAASVAEREKELAAVKLQVAEVSEFSEGKLATARQDLSQEIIAEVDEIRMKFQERNAKLEAVLKRREREFAAVKQQLGEFRKAAKQEANELRDIVGALQEGSENAGARVREEGGRELIKQRCEAVWNGTAEGGHHDGAGQAIWQRLDSASGKPKLDMSGAALALWEVCQPQDALPPARLEWE